MIKKITLVISIIILGVFTATSQIDTVWTKTLGGTGNESTLLFGADWTVPSIDSDAAGNLYVLGRSNTISGDIHQSLGGEDCWIIKLNSNGDTLWTKVFGGTNGDIPTDILVLDNGNFFITGYTFSNNGDFSGHHAPNLDEDGFIVRFDTDGNVMWSKLYGGGDFGGISGHDIINRVTLLSNGNLLAVGNTNSNNGDLPLDFTKFGAAWILRVDTANGNLISTKKVVGPNHNEFNSNLLISVSELMDESGYYALGETRYSLQPYRMWLVKFDNNDNMIWNKEFGSSFDNRANSVLALPNKKALITGVVYDQSGDVSTYNGGLGDAWVAVIDSNQNLIKEVAYGGTLWDQPYTLKKMSNNTYIVGGTSQSTDNYLHQNLGSLDFWLVNFDENLDTNWTYSFGGSDGDVITGVTADNNGNIYVTGTTESNDFYVHNNNGGRDLFLAKIQNAFSVGITSSELNKNAFKIYPNPSNGLINIVAEKEIESIKIYNSIGALSLVSTHKSIVINNLTNGIYYITIQFKSGEIQRKKLIKI